METKENNTTDDLCSICYESSEKLNYDFCVNAICCNVHPICECCYENYLNWFVHFVNECCVIVRSYLWILYANHF